MNEINNRIKGTVGDFFKDFKPQEAKVNSSVNMSSTKKMLNKKAKTEQGSYYNGKPLQTPMPFTGKAVPMPVTMLTMQQQGKRAGGKTKASRDEPRAAIVTTKDGKQWAIGSRGLEDIPESHRQEVADMLSSQFAFLRDALKTTL